MFKHIVEFEGNVDGTFFTAGPMSEEDIRAAEKEAGKGIRRIWSSEEVDKKEFEGVKFSDPKVLNSSENITDRGEEISLSAELKAEEKPSKKNKK